MSYSIDAICKDAEILALRIDEANIKAGIKQMVDMCEWLEMEVTVDFDWRSWVGSYEECPVEDHHLLDSKGIFVRMAEDAGWDAYYEAWKQYSVLFDGETAGVDLALLQITSIEKDGNVYFFGQHKGHEVIVEVNISKHTSINALTDIASLADDETLDGMAVWIDGELDFMYGYPNLGPNGHMVATPTP